MGLGHEPVAAGRGSWAAGLLYFTAHETDPTVLLLRRSRHVDFSGTWSAPGGFGRPDETPYVAARREAYEETGYVGGRYRDTHVEPGALVSTYYTFLVEVREPFAPILNHENTDWAWFPLTTLGTLNLHPGFAVSVETFRMKILAVVNASGHEFDSRS